MEPFEVRMIVEFSQLDSRIEKLDSFIVKQGISPTVDSVELDLLNQQLALMKQYREILATRCKSHNITI